MVRQHFGGLGMWLRCVAAHEDKILLASKNGGSPAQRSRKPDLAYIDDVFSANVASSWMNF
jgi:hypothetical protein